MASVTSLPNEPQRQHCDENALAPLSTPSEQQEALPFQLDPLSLDPIRFSYFGVLTAAKEVVGDEEKVEHSIEEDGKRVTVLLDPVVSRNRFTLKALKSFDRNARPFDDPSQLDPEESVVYSVEVSDVSEVVDDGEREAREFLEAKVVRAAKLMYLDNYSALSIGQPSPREVGERQGEQPEEVRVATKEQFTSDEDQINSFRGSEESDDDYDDRFDDGSVFEVCVAELAEPPAFSNKAEKEDKDTDVESFIEAGDTDDESVFEDCSVNYSDSKRPEWEGNDVQEVEQPSIVVIPTEADEAPLSSHLSPPPRKPSVATPFGLPASPAPQAPLTLPPRSPFRLGLAEMDATVVVEEPSRSPELSDFEKEVLRAAELERLKEEEEAAYQEKEREEEARWLERLEEAQAAAALEREREVAAEAEAARVAIEESRVPTDEKEVYIEDSQHCEEPPVKPKTPKVPKHPIASMQEAFAESMLEAAEGIVQDKGKTIIKDAAERRKILLDQDVSEETHASRWKQKPGQRYHELWKLVAQISFGSYLLFDGMAKNDADVLAILQGHVDEIDEFLEATLQDFDYASVDIRERLECLKIPMENVVVFDQMLSDREFRSGIVAGNEVVEHAITRTATAMNDALKDVQQGLSATKEFAIWLNAVEKTARWMPDRPEMQKVYKAMKGNAGGWYAAFASLQTKGNHLGVALVQLGSIVAEMDRRAGEVSRKMRFSLEAQRESVAAPASPPQSPPRRQTSQLSGSSNGNSANAEKDLPKDNMITPAIKATLPTFQHMGDRQRTPPAEADAEMESIIEEGLTLQPTVFTLQPRAYSPSSLSPARLAKVTHTPTSSEYHGPPAARRLSTTRQRLSLKRKSIVSAMLPSNSLHAPVRKGSSDTTMISPRTVPRTMENHQGEPPLRQQQERGQRQPSPISIQTQNTTRSDFVPRSMNQQERSTYSISGIEVLPQNAPSPSTISLPARKQPNPNSISGSPRTVDISYFPPPPSQPNSPFLSSPRSDQQHFRPVAANPNSPLQRPWTAAPTVQQHEVRDSHGELGLHPAFGYQNRSQTQVRQSSTHSSSPGASQVHRSTMTTSQYMPQEQNGHHLSVYQGNSGAQSVYSTRSTGAHSTRVVEEGKKVKKKKSGFGWLKKAFSLSEEEKAEFEARKQAAQDLEQSHDSYRPSGYNDRYGYSASVYERQAPRFLDGRRIG